MKVPGWLLFSGIPIYVQSFSVDSRKSSLHYVVYKFTPDERSKVIVTFNNPRFTDLTPAQILAILAMEELYMGTESNSYRLVRQEGPASRFSA